MSATCSRGWASRCARSKGPKCKCRCGGENHGGKPKPEENHAAHDAVAALLAEVGVVGAWRRPVFTYSGLFGRTVVTDLTIIKGGPLPVVIATERDDNPGASITNTIELLSRALYAETGWQPNEFILIEHYPAERHGGFLPRSLSTVHLERMWSGVSWKHIEAADIPDMLNRGAALRAEGQ